jgi:hypothetical protein
MTKSCLTNCYDVVAATALAIVMTLSCHTNDYYNELPDKLVSFIAQYFPNTGVESYSQSNDKYIVKLVDGPGLTFSSSYSWLDINGYGMVLPQVLLFDQLPPALYQYLQETENLHNVFTISRNKSEYTVTLLDSTLTYNIATGRLHGS